MEDREGVGVVGECRNIASRDLITKIVGSSEIPACQVSNTLVRDPQKLWLSDIGMPQYLTLHFAEKKDRGIEERDDKIRTFGWYCWHSYTSNPAEIVLKVSTDGKNYHDLCDIEGSNRAGIHLRSIDPPLDVRAYPYVRLLFQRNYGGDRVYVNRLYLYRETLEKVEADVQRLLSSNVKSVASETNVETATLQTKRSSAGIPGRAASREDPVDSLIRKIERARAGDARDIAGVLRGDEVGQDRGGGTSTDALFAKGEAKDDTDDEKEEGNSVRHDPPGLHRAVADAKRRKSSISDSLLVSEVDARESSDDDDDHDEHDRLQRQLKEMELLVGKCAKHRRPRTFDKLPKTLSRRRRDGDAGASKLAKKGAKTDTSAGDDRLSSCIRSIDKMERRVSRLTKTMGAIVTQLDLGRVGGSEAEEDATANDKDADDIFNNVPMAINTPCPRRRGGNKAGPSAVTPLQRELQPLLEKILTSWATQLLTAQSESMRRRLDHRLKLERQFMLTELMKAQRSFTDKWSARQMKRFENLVRETVHEASSIRRPSGKASSSARTETSSTPRRRRTFNRESGVEVPTNEDTLEKLVSRRARKLARLAAVASVPMALRRQKERDVEDLDADTELDNEVNAILRDGDVDLASVSLYNDRRDAPVARRLPRTKKSASGRSRSKTSHVTRGAVGAVARPQRSRRRMGDVSLRRAFK